MNYLSHYFIHQQGPDPLFSLGLVFPDLSRGYVKFPGKLEPGSYGNLLRLSEGCLQHYAADKIFHGSTFFEWGTHLCIAQIKKAQFETAVERRWFIGHILFEMLIDRILVRHQYQVAEDFYSDLNAVDTDQLREFISLHEHKEIDRFLRFFDHFRRAAYIHNYPDNNLFAFSLGRIMLKAGLPELSLTDKIVLQECVWELEGNSFKNAQGLLFELKEVFK